VKSRFFTTSSQKNSITTRAIVFVLARKRRRCGPRARLRAGSAMRDDQTNKIWRGRADSLAASPIRRPRRRRRDALRARLATAMSETVATHVEHASCAR
jgi:hypothetical protein